MNICVITGKETTRRGNLFHAEVPIGERVVHIHARVDTGTKVEPVSVEGFLDLIEKAYFHDVSPPESTPEVAPPATVTKRTKGE